MKLVLALLALLAVPAASALDIDDDPLRRVQRGADAHDPLLAALGEATVACLGRVSTRDFRVNRDGALERAFDTCTTRDTGSLERIDQLLGVQHSREGQADGLSAHFAEVWTRAARAFPQRLIQQCPDWELLHVIDAPTPERVAFFAAQEGAAGIGKEYRWFKVSSPQCGSNGFCAVLQARLCAAGFTDQFVVWSDPFSSTVIIDPIWWQTHYDYENQSDPFSTGDYKHRMS
ncbi:MAG: hypothetical protein ACREQ8_16220, partial [Woeseiaceae bacterium]